MIRFTRSDMQRVAVSTVGALILSTACVAGAIAPARAAEPNAPLTTGDWQARVSRQLDAKMSIPAFTLRNDDHAIATINVRFDADGVFSGASLAKSSGLAAIDSSALRTARAIAYPALPAGLRGKPQTVAVQLYYGIAADGEDAAGRKRAFEALAARQQRRDGARQIAALPTG